MPEDASDSTKPSRDTSGWRAHRATMELANRLRVIRRWLWLIVAVVAVTAVMLVFWLVTTAPEYKATAKIGLPTLTERGVTAVQQVLKSEPVRQQTIDQLGLEGNASEYGLEVMNVGSAGFLELTVISAHANLAGPIANTHAEAAIAYFDALRAQPAEEDLRVLDAQLDEARNNLAAAEQAFADFRTENALGSLNERLIQYERNLGTLRTDRDRRSMMGLSIVRIEETIAERLQALTRVTALAPTYNALEDAVAQAQKEFNLSHNKHIAAELALSAAQATDDIDVIGPAKAWAQPDSAPGRLFAIGLAGAVGLGIALAFTLESVFPSKGSQEEQES